MDSGELINQRKEKILAFFKTKAIWVIVLLAIAVILGVYIRSLPMTDHGGHPGLWDITTNSWALGPDLDPWLFERYAKTIVDNGSLPRQDDMRYVPRGFDTTTELQMVSYMIVITYKIVNLFGNYSVVFAADVNPVIMFGFTIIAFFLLVREIFVRKNESKVKANIIALISTFFMIVIPVFLSRTIAGIPEKEANGFVFMFLAFYLFLKAWKSEKIMWASLLGVLAGISTALMGLTWGGVVYIYVAIALAVFVAFILNKIHKKEFILYSLWLFASWAITLIFSNRDTLKGLITSLDSGMAFLILFIIAVHFLIWKTKISKVNLLQTTKIPKNIISLIAAIVLGIVLVSVAFGPSFIFNKISDLNQIFFQPVTGRFNTTVAENQQPFFTEWESNFGPILGGFPVLFWLFFIGSVTLFKKMLKNIKNKDAWVLTCLYILFFFGLVFSRYSSTSVFNGENFVSKAFYYLSALLLAGYLIYYYFKYHKEGHQGFEKTNFEYLFLFSIFILCLFTARSAVRLIMVLGPIAPIFLAFLAVESADKFRQSKEDTSKLVFGILAILIIISGVFIFWSFYKDISNQSYSYVPSYYNQQWQKAMSWVRTSTPTDAVFAHWWDYGYWVQSIGNRATMLDGGNKYSYWDYLVGRDVLTTDNQNDALELLHTHNVSYFLVDSSDIGKYSAFSSIGSDANYDRLSWISTMVSDASQVKETSNGTVQIYNSPRGNGQVGIIPLDEDIDYNMNGTNIFMPSGNAGLIGIYVESQKGQFLQPYGIFIYNGQQIQIPFRYLYEQGKSINDFGSGINATAFLMQSVSQTSQGVQIDKYGAAMYISPRLMRGFFAQVYLLSDPFNKYPNFQLVHDEPNLIISSLNGQNASLNEFSYLGDVMGPIKIWKIKYNGNEKINSDDLLTVPPASITWAF